MKPLHCLLAVLLFAATAFAATDWNSIRHIPLDRVGVHAHRGGGFVKLCQEPRSRKIIFQSLPYTSDSAISSQLLGLGLLSFATDYANLAQRELTAHYVAKTSRK